MMYGSVSYAGLSMSDDYLLYTLYSSFIRIICSLVVWFEIWHVLGNTDVSLDQIISSVNVIFIHLVTIWKLVTMVNSYYILIKYRGINGKHEYPTYYRHTHTKII